MTTLEKYNITFINKVIDYQEKGKEIYKLAESNNYDLSNFLSDLHVSRSVDSILLDINKALSNPEFEFENGNELIWVTIYNDRVEFYDYGVELVYELPTQDFKEILIAWRNFLSTPPLHGSKIYKSIKTGFYVDFCGNKMDVKADVTASDDVTKPVKIVENIFLDPTLKPYISKNKLTFAIWLTLFIVFSFFGFIILPSIDVGGAIMVLSVLGAICISFSGFCSILYYKSWEKAFIQKVVKPKLDFSTYFIVGLLPTILFYFMISWNFIDGPGYNLYKAHTTIKFIKSLIP